LLRQSDAQAAFAAFRVFYAQVVDQRPKTSTWKFFLVDDKRLCESCDEFRGELHELENDDDLYELFPYGDFIDNDVFQCLIHPNCRCIVERQG
jgi:hypothetical protein